MHNTQAHEQMQVESAAMHDFARLMQARPNGLSGRFEINEDDVKNGLGQLVLTLVKLLHELLERQAIRRMEAGSLNEEEVEQVGVALMQQADELKRLTEAFGLKDSDLNIDLGPLGKLL